MTQTTLITDSTQQEALSLLRAGQLYAGVDLAWKSVDRSKRSADTTPLVGELSRALERLGLPEFAAHLSRGFSGPTGALPWGMCRERWSANLKALQSRDNDLATALRSAWNAGRGAFELHRCSDGNEQIRLVSQPGAGAWLPAFADHRRVADEVQPPGGRFATGNSLLIHGIHFGRLLDRAYAGTHKVFLDFSCCMYVLAPNHAELAAAMHLRDWSEFLADRRVVLLVGPDCIEQLGVFLREHPGYPLPAWRMTQPSWDSSRVDELAEVLERAVQHRESEAWRTYAAVEQVYGNRDVDYWAARYARRDREPLRVLGIVSRHSTFIRGSMQDSLAALESLGCECRLLTEREPFIIGHGARECHQVQTEFKPDLILMIDNHRAQLGGLLTPNVPVMMWIQDSLGRLLSPDTGRAMGPLDFVMGYSRRTCIEDCEYAPEGFLECDVPTGFGLLASVRAEWRDRHTCDVSFVSTASKPPEQIHAERRAESPPELWPLIDAIYDQVRSVLARGSHVCHPKQFLERMIAETGVQVDEPQTKQDLETWYVYRLFDWGYRQEALLWTAEWARATGHTFHLYGRGWDSFPGLEEFARGHIWDREELAAIHCLSRVNLQLFAYTALHQRTYDILGVGGFPLFRKAPADYRDEQLEQLDEFLKEHAPRELLKASNSDMAEIIRTQFGELNDWVERAGKTNGNLSWARGTSAAAKHPRLVEATFNSREQLQERLEHLLGDGADRGRLARELRESILPDSTYRARMEKAIDFISRRLALRARYGCRGHRAARGPEEAGTSTILVYRDRLRAYVPDVEHRINDAQEQCIRWMREGVSGCHEMAVERKSGHHEQLLDFIDRHKPDVVVNFSGNLPSMSASLRISTLVLAPMLHGRHLQLTGGECLHYAGAANFVASQVRDSTMAAAWTGLSPANVRTFWWPCQTSAGQTTRRQYGHEQPACDLTVSLAQPEPAAGIVKAYLQFLSGDTKAMIGNILKGLSQSEFEVLGDATNGSLTDLRSICDHLLGEGDVPSDDANLIGARNGALPCIVETFWQEQWLVRLWEWATRRGLSMRIEAPSTWKEHPQIGGIVKPWTEIGRRAPGRLHIGLSSGPATSHDDLCRILDGTPTLLWGSSQWQKQWASRENALADLDHPMTEQLCADAAEMRFTSWGELTERIKSHLSEPGPLTALTRSAADVMRPKLEPRGTLCELLDWVLGNR